MSHLRLVEALADWSIARPRLFLHHANRRYIPVPFAFFSRGWLLSDNCSDGGPSAPLSAPALFEVPPRRLFLPVPE